MLKAEIVDPTVQERSGTNSRGAWTLRTQSAVLHVGAFRFPLEVPLDRNQPAFSAGIYLVDDTSFATDNYARMIVKRLVLKAPAAAAAGQPSTARTG